MNGHSGESEQFDMVWSWRWLDNQRATQLWAELYDWVEWLRDRYQIPQETLPGCWWRHGAAVEELTALMCAHKGAYRADSAPGDYRGDLSAWHHYDLEPCLHRLPTVAKFTGCTTRECSHTPKPPRRAGGFDEHVAADVAARPDPAPVDRSVTEPSESEVEGETVLSAAAMAQALAAGLADPVNPRHPERAVRFSGRLWLLDAATCTYRPADQQPDENEQAPT